MKKMPISQCPGSFIVSYIVHYDYGKLATKGQDVLDGSLSECIPRSLIGHGLLFAALHIV